MIKPSRIIGPDHNPYMLRWHILRIRKLPRIYVHKFMRSDDDRALHDHPWWFCSILLRGTYLEHRPSGSTLRIAPSVAFRKATDTHRIELLEDIKPWTLFITGPVIRKWGFWCKDRFVVAKEFESRGCGDD